MNLVDRLPPSWSFFRLFAWALCLGVAAWLWQAGPAAAQGQTGAAGFAPGQALPGLTLRDQHDKPWAIAPATRLVLFAAGRKASNLVQAALQELPRDQLSLSQAVYLADMSKMPGFITRTFALPALREMPYAIGVSMDEATLQAWPRQADAVTLIELEQGLVKRVSYLSAEADIKSALSR